LADELRRHRDAYGQGDDGGVFANERGGLVRRTGFRTRIWKPALMVAGLPDRMRFHDLRHGAASLLLAQGVHPRVVMDMLGHSTIALTMNTYSHVIPDLQREAAAKMEALLG
jgi:integrase